LTPRDVFVSHASEDHAIAGQVCDLLEQRGLRCWIAPRDVGAGVEWDEAILDAIEKSRAYLLILSAQANKSSFVKNELNRAFSSGKSIVTLRIEDVLPGRSLELYLARHHWTDAFPPPIEPKIDQLATSLRELLSVAEDGAPRAIVAAPSSPPVHATHAVPTPARKPMSTPGGKGAWMTVAAIAVLGMIAMVLPLLRHLHEVPSPETRTEIVTPATDQPGDFALSPDGRQIVFVAKGDGAQRLWIRPLATTVAQPLPGTEGATAPFWSPDSRSVGFFAEDSLKRLDLDVGTPRTLAPASSQAGSAGSWNADGIIVFSGNALAPISRIAANGGQMAAVTRLGPRDALHSIPQFLPDGRRFLYLALGAGVEVASLQGGTPVQLLPFTGDFEYSMDGWLLWIDAGALMAQRLDVEKVALTGKPVKIADRADYVSAGPHGLLAFRTVSVRRQLTWVDRSGAVQATLGDPDDTINTTHIAPDGRRLAMVHPVHDHTDVWVRDGERMSRLTSEVPYHFNPIWSPDGTHVLYMSVRSAKGDIYQKLASGEGAEELLVHADQAQIPFSMSPDGRFLLYGRLALEGGDIWVLPMAGDRKPFVFLQTPFSEGGAQFSPDGHWVAYQSNEAGQNEVYVRPFVVPGTGKDAASATAAVRVSTGGGAAPVWRADGKELYFLNQANDMMAVPMTTTGSALVPGTPLRLFKSGITPYPSSGVFNRDYDVAPDGRFLINRELEGNVTTPITLIQNWNPEAKK
jgi:eukaryotic-like serine/threonine-protein kinase